MFEWIKNFLKFPPGGIKNIGDLGNYVKNYWWQLIIFVVVLIVIFWIIAKILKIFFLLIRKS
ncbi:MAG: hypothetical protein mread185_000241 [Mycoplasmataceae bacterium]|nr:MAG: hypothetical protein mread185_000241 [Mycoplasmataceae bacterium]